MKNFFENISTSWVRYDKYEWKETSDGAFYLKPANKAMPAIYDPLKDGQNLVLDAIATGAVCTSKEPDEKKRQAILNYVTKYGLLGLMTALPTTPNFMDYEYVYLPKNAYFKEESMDVMDYLDYFFPFEKPDVIKRGVESSWTVHDDRTMLALMMTMMDQPTAINMSFQIEYSERFDWLVQAFTDWRFIFISTFLYYEDYDSLPEQTKELMRQSMAAFNGNIPSYHIALKKRPTIVWDFHSLMLSIHMLFSFMLTDENKPLRMCKHCQKAFVASRPTSAFCSPQCKNRYNVYKSRAKNKSEDGESND